MPFLDPGFTASLFIGGLILAGWAWSDLRQAQDAHNWPTTSGRILRRSTDDAHFRGRNSWLPLLWYRYTVEGTRYEGKRLSFRTYWTPKAAMHAAYHYDQGQTVKVHYHPEAPERSVLELETGEGPHAGLVLGIIIALLGLVAFIWQAAV